MSSLIRRVRNLRAAALDAPVAARERSTPRLVLRPYAMDDIEDWLAIEHDESVRDALGWPRRTTRDAVAHLRARTHHTTLVHAGDLLVLATEYRGHAIGDVSVHLRTIAASTRSVEIGWLLRSEFRGEGLATEAADAMLWVAFEQIEANLVTAVISDRNEPSARLALRLGFRLAAHRPGTSTYVLSREDHRAATESAATELPRDALRFPAESVCDCRAG